jgi:PAP2 superfamily
VSQTVEQMTTARPRTSSRVRPRWWAELGLVAATYAVYSLIRNLIPTETGAALRRAARLFDIERAWHVAPEVGLNAAVSSHHALALVVDYHYATMHYVVTPVVLVWLLITQPGAYRHARRILIMATILGLIGFWLAPVAPPRMLDADGFVDTMAKFAAYGWWSTDASAPRGLGGLTNEYAAMPSLHVGWAIWCGWMVARYARRRWIRVLGILYPVSTVVVVLATANHFFLDVVGGIGVILLAIPLVRAGERLGRQLTVRRAAPSLPT